MWLSKAMLFSPIYSADRIAHGDAPWLQNLTRTTSPAGTTNFSYELDLPLHCGRAGWGSGIHQP